MWYVHDSQQDADSAISHDGGRGERYIVARSQQEAEEKAVQLYGPGKVGGSCRVFFSAGGKGGERG